MREYRYLLVFTGVIIASSLIISSGELSTGADANEQRAVNAAARDAAVTGLNMSVKQLVADHASWHEQKSVDSTKYEFVDVASTEYSSYSTTVIYENYAKGPALDRCLVDTVDVVAVGLAVSSEFETIEGTHRLEATYVRTCNDDLTAPEGARLLALAEW